MFSSPLDRERTASTDIVNLLQMQEMWERPSFEGVIWCVPPITSLNDLSANFLNIDGPNGRS